jgi:cytoskeletal protein CcmA (bactofilin family)
MGIFGKPSEEKRPEPVRPAASPAAPAPSPAARASSACTIGAKTRLKGELAGDEDVLVEGEVEGQVRLTRDLRVAPGGVLKAAVAARSLIVAGEVQGDCQVTERVEIQATGRVAGNIKAPRIIIAEGAVFRGTSDMGEPRPQK